METSADWLFHNARESSTRVFISFARSAKNMPKKFYGTKKKQADFVWLQQNTIKCILFSATLKGLLNLKKKYMSVEKMFSPTIIVETVTEHC